MIALALRFLPQIAGVLVVLAILAGTYAKGRNDESDSWRLKVAEQREAAAEKERELARAIGAQARDLAAARGKREVITQTQVREVEHYVPMVLESEAARQCARLPGGWRVLHDAAAAGLPAPPPAPVGTPDTPGPTPTDSLRAVVGNYGQCLAWRDQVIGWQRWYETVSKGQ